MIGERARVAGEEERTVSFSEVRRNLSRKMGKRGGEIWPPSRISSGHGGEVLQEFTVVCTIRPFFPSFCFSSCHRGNKKRFLLLPLPRTGTPAETFSGAVNGNGNSEGICHSVFSSIDISVILAYTFVINL